MNLLQERGAVDEIGIGLVRDAFVNLFFPGTSTVQTGAKYFLIVSCVLKEARSGKVVPASDAATESDTVSRAFCVQEERKSASLFKGLINCSKGIYKLDFLCYNIIAEKSVLEVAI